MDYKRSKYFTTSNKRKIKYLFIKKSSQITVVFFHGFMSNMVGEKPTSIQKFCKKEKISFLKFEYSGHGKSNGKFINGNISKWTDDAKQLIKSKLKKNENLIFVGSSMGSWIALNLFPYFSKQIKGFVGISSAPDFLEELIWKKFNFKTKSNTIKKKIHYFEHSGFSYPLTKQLIFDGRKNKVINNKINLKIPITLLHGNKDDVVPLIFSKRILKVCKKSQKKLVIIKNGNHRLSRKKDLKKICSELNYIIKSNLSS